MTSRNLVIVRCGRSSLHRAWFHGNEHPDFDLVLSRYEGDMRSEGGYRYIPHVYVGAKWEGVADAIGPALEGVSNYDYIWVPDDDLATNIADINRLFRLMAKYKFALAQPSLAWGSYYSHPITLHQRGCAYRETNFVEVMAPCFSIDAFKAILPTLPDSRSAFGLDYLWPQLVSRFGKVGIIDALQVLHTRVVGSAEHGGTADTAQADLERVISKYQLNPALRVTKLMLLNGQVFASKLSRMIVLIAGAKGERLRSPWALRNLIAEVWS